jgi:hypothetical protein
MEVSSALFGSRILLMQLTPSSWPPNWFSISKIYLIEQNVTSKESLERKKKKKEKKIRRQKSTFL